MFSQTAEYALRAMVVLAGADGEPLTASSIAQRSNVPLDYLCKVMNQLCRAGLVRAQRGRGGGFAPSRALADTTALEVVNAVDPIRRIKTCPLGIHGKDLCPLHRKLDDALRQVEEALAGATLASLVSDPKALPSSSSCKGDLCHVATV